MATYGTSTITLNNAITVSNQFNIGASTVSGVSASGNIDFTGNVSLGNATRRTFNVNDGTAIFSGSISSLNTSGGMRSISGGTLRFEGPITLGGLVEDSGGTFSLGSNNGSGLLVQSMGGLQVDGGLTASVLNPANHSNRTVVETGGLTLAGTTNSWTSYLDLSGNDMIVHNGSIGQLTNQVAKGYNGAAWNGNGIRSSAAANYTTHYYSLGVIQNSVDGTPTGTALYSTFDGQTVANSDVLIKYTWSGDTNLDGVIDGTDFSRIDYAYLVDQSHPGSVTGWFNGDFNYDGNVTMADYTIIDNTYSYSNNGGGTLARSGGDPLAVLEQLWHWKLPGYAAYYLPIYEQDFGPLTTAEYDQAISDGTPANGLAPAYFAPSAALFSDTSSTPLVVSAAVPEPASFGFILAITGAGMLGRSSRRRKV